MVLKSPFNLINKEGCGLTGGRKIEPSSMLDEYSHKNRRYKELLKGNDQWLLHC